MKITPIEGSNSAIQFVNSDRDLLRRGETKEKLKLFSALFFTILGWVSSAVFVVILLGGIGFLLSAVTGRNSLLKDKQVSIKFIERTILTQVYSARSTVEFLSELNQVTCFACNETSKKSNSEKVVDLEKLFLSYAELNKHLNMHHLRLVSRTGMELVRIDMNHSSFPFVSKSLYDVSEKQYHLDFLDDKSTIETFYGDWTTHAPLPNGSHYEYSGNDPDGDHHLSHIEILPLPSLMKVQKSILCEKTTSEAYIIVNVRMIITLNEIRTELKDLGDTYVINKKGEYIYNSRDRNKEFQTLTGKLATLALDFRDAQILEKMALHTLGEHGEIIINKFYSSFLLCERITLGGPTSEHYYYVCHSFDLWECIKRSPIWIFLGICTGIIIVFVLMGVGIAVKQSKMIKEKNKFKDFAGSVFPKTIAPRILARNDFFIAEHHREIAIIFADIVGFTEFSNSLSPERLILALGSIFNCIDDIALCFNVEKIKTIGDCYFGVGGLDFDLDLRFGYSHLRNVILFANVCMRLFLAKKLNIQGKHLSIPQFRWGVHVGDVVAGVLEKKMPLFDMYGVDVNYASRMESSGEPGKVQVSLKMKDILSSRMHLHQDMTFTERLADLKGIGEQTAFFVDVDFHSNDLIDEVLEMTQSLKHLGVSEVIGKDVLPNTISNPFLNQSVTEADLVVESLELKETVVDFVNHDSGSSEKLGVIQIAHGERRKSF